MTNYTAAGYTLLLLALIGMSIGCAAAPSQGEVVMQSAEPSTTETRFERGWQRLRNLDGEAAERVIQALEDTAPDLARFTIEYPYGDVFDRDKLDYRSRQIATVAALTALGNARPQLKFHLHAALNVGVTRGEIIAIMEQMSVYAGFPAALNGVFAAKEVFEERDRTHQ